jgi:hypothetical protein
MHDDRLIAPDPRPGTRDVRRAAWQGGRERRPIGHHERELAAGRALERGAPAHVDLDALHAQRPQALAQCRPDALLQPGRRPAPDHEDDQARTLLHDLEFDDVAAA